MYDTGAAAACEQLSKIAAISACVLPVACARTKVCWQHEPLSARVALHSTKLTLVSHAWREPVRTAELLFVTLHVVEQCKLALMLDENGRCLQVLVYVVCQGAQLKQTSFLHICLTDH
jgi:hypothetical protein